MKNYETFVKNSPSRLIECKDIVLFKWSGTPKISIETLDEIINKVSSDSSIKKYISHRDNSNKDTPYEIELNGEEFEFNVIVYLLGVDSVGYTLFYNPQVAENVNKVFIYFDFSYDYIKDSIIKIENSLSDHVDERYIGNLDIYETGTYYLYTTRKMIDDNIISSYQRYSNDINHFILDKNISTINCNKYISNTRTLQLRLNEPYLKYPDNIKVGIYNEDIVLYEWNRTEFRVVSLSNYDESGDPKIYKEGVVQLSSESDDRDPINLPILIEDILSEYIVGSDLNTGLETTVCSWKTQENIGYTNSTKPDTTKLLSNPYISRSAYFVDNSSGNLNISDRVANSELLDSIYSSVYFNDGIVGNIVDYIGSFIIVENGTEKIFSNNEGTVFLSSNSNSMVVNDSCILEQTPTKLNFYFTDNGATIYSDYFSYNGIDKTKEEYRYLKLSVDRWDVTNQIIDGFRKHSISYKNLPEISCTFGGILFYISDNKLKHL